MRRKEGIWAIYNANFLFIASWLRITLYVTLLESGAQIVQQKKSQGTTKKASVV